MGTATFTVRYIGYLLSPAIVSSSSELDPDEEDEEPQLGEDEELELGLVEPSGKVCW